MLESLATLAAASALLLGSPGPVPVALAATGASFGFRKSAPFLLGIISGLSVVLCATLFGLSILLKQFPAITFTLQILSCLYLLYIAYKIGAVSSTIQQRASEVPGYRTGFIFNIINPKAYAAMLTLLSQPLLVSNDSITVLLIASTCILLVGLLVDTLWLVLGGTLKPVFNKGNQQRVIRIVFALLISSLAFYGLLKVIIFD
ncbi:LysE family translocator [Kangiella japonica]|uniref:LysE family translocator n=1 Tax=Kangiella japonica TaxID=647384 RepID=A0ABN0T769_9GAMM